MSNDGYGSDEYAQEYSDDTDIPTHFTPSAESMVHDAGWYVTDTGKRIERGLQLAKLALKMM